MSILDNIQEAEKNAEERRQTARAEAREIVRQARADAKQKQKEKLEAIRSACAENIKQDEIEQISLMEKQRQKFISEDQTIVTKAKENKEKAVDFILERIQDQ